MLDGREHLFASSSAQNRGAEMIFGRKKKPAPSFEYDYTYEVQIAGVTHDFRQVAVSGLRDGQALDLVPEPTNPHDPHAVAVYAKKKQVGYVPAFKSQMVAEFIAAGRDVDAKVLAIEPFIVDGGYEALGVRMFLGLGRREAQE